MTVNSSVSNIYLFNGSLAGLDLGGVLNASLLNRTGGARNGEFVDNNGQLAQSDDGSTTFSLSGGPAQPINYVGSGTISTLGLLGILLDPRPVAIFEAGGQVFFYAPNGLPLLSNITFSLDIDPNAPFPLPAAPDGKVDGLDTGQTMNVGYTDLQGDRITNGSDQIFANGGDDTVRAGRGNDTVFGGEGADSILGEAGNDVLHGDEGNDRLFGGEGNDTLFGGAGDDYLEGGAGDDVLNGGTGNDTVLGGAGNDTITVEAGVNLVDGGNDRDTVIVIDGENSSGSILRGGEGGDDFDTLDLTNAGPRQVLRDEENPENGTINWLDENGVPTGSSTRFEGFEQVICFTTGTEITTLRGQVCVEDLVVGDKVLTLDHGYRPIRWIGTKRVSARVLSANENLRPVLVRAGALGNGLPECDLVVSRQHRMLIRSRVAQRVFGDQELLMPAKDLLEIRDVSLIDNGRPVEYWHILFDDHEVIFSNGAPTESFHVGSQSKLMVAPETMEEIVAIFPDIATVARQLARTEARGQKARHMIQRMTSNKKPLVAAPESLPVTVKHLTQMTTNRMQ